MTILCRWREESVEPSTFYTNKDIDKLIAETEATVTSELEGGDRSELYSSNRDLLSQIFVTLCVWTKLD